MKKNERDMFQILKRILSKNEIEQLSNKLVIEDGKGYELYGEYSIRPSGNMYKTIKFTTFTEHKFYSLRNAAVWVSLDKTNQIIDAQRVLELDKVLEGALINAEIHRKLYKNTKSLEAKSLYYAKLQEDNTKRQYVVNQLETYVSKVKAWQEKCFKEAAK
jgi:hypothetical protein